MSQLYFNTNESNDSDNQFNNGIKIIVSAYENNCQILSSEINRLNNELEKKNKKISELEELCSSLLNQKNSYENKISDLKNKNEKITNQMEKIKKENIELKKIKQTIINTLEYNNNKIKTIDNISGKNNITLLNGGKKENKDNKNIKISKGAFSNILNLKKKNKEFNFLTEKNKSYSCERVHSRTRTNSINEIDSLTKFLIKQENENINYNNNDNIKNNFFKQCRNTMNSNHYSDLMNIVHLFNLKEITKKEMYDNIIEIFKKFKYENLIDSFNNLFS
jgi:DNA repair ATPase RecN